MITGEGRLDTQTLSGKLPAVVARRAAPLPVIAVVGSNAIGHDESPFAAVYAAAEHSATDTARDAEATRKALRRIGIGIGMRTHPASVTPGVDGTRCVSSA